MKLKAFHIWLSCLSTLDTHSGCSDRLLTANRGKSLCKRHTAKKHTGDHHLAHSFLVTQVTKWPTIKIHCLRTRIFLNRLAVMCLPAPATVHPCISGPDWHGFPSQTLKAFFMLFSQPFVLSRAISFWLEDHYCYCRNKTEVALVVENI